MKQYWLTTCKNCCNQGLLFIMKNLSTQKLYLHCGECEWGWHDPETVDDQNAKFLTLEQDFEADFATLIEIAKEGWSKYKMNLIEE
jgi:hypothetical protein